MWIPIAYYDNAPTLSDITSHISTCNTTSTLCMNGWQGQCSFYETPPTSAMTVTFMSNCTCMIDTHGLNRKCDIWTYLNPPRALLSIDPQYILSHDIIITTQQLPDQVYSRYRPIAAMDNNNIYLFNNKTGICTHGNVPDRKIGQVTTSDYNFSNHALTWVFVLNES